MREELVTFKTAVLASDKSFNWETDYVYCTEEEDTDDPMVYNYGSSLIGDEELYAPTQSLLQKWLREVHNFHITICNTNPGDKVDFKFSMAELYKSDNDNSRKYIVLGSKGTFKTYEEALEIALQEALKLIKTSHL